MSDSVYTFGDRENWVGHVPAGDYKCCVVGVARAISAGKRTRGSEMVVLELEVMGKGSRFKERLTLHESCFRKIDTFVKSFNILNAQGKKPVKGEALMLMPSNCVGAIGWCNLRVKEYPREGQDPGFANEVVVFHTDKEKFQRIHPSELAKEDETEPEDDGWDGDDVPMGDGSNNGEVDCSFD